MTDDLERSDEDGQKSIAEAIQQHVRNNPVTPENLPERMDTLADMLSKGGAQEVVVVTDSQNMVSLVRAKLGRYWVTVRNTFRHGIPLAEQPQQQERETEEQDG